MRSCLMMMVLLAACGGDDDAPRDAAADVDAPIDVGRRDSRPQDTGPVCTPACTGESDCCLVDGTPTCVNTLTDDTNCGLCGIQCGLELGRGTTCELGRCVCGGVDIGCDGTDLSWCCPGRTVGTLNYCANFFMDTRDCGGCGLDCLPLQASHCTGMQCRCGGSRDACTGEPDSICCPGLADFSCVDSTNDREHCGECENRCALSESCIDGECIVPGDAG